MSKKKKELQINYLDLIPERSAQLRWHTDIRGRMVLEIENKARLTRLPRSCLENPDIRRYIWMTMAHLSATHRWQEDSGRYCCTGKRRIWGEGRAFISKDR